MTVVATSRPVRVDHVEPPASGLLRCTRGMVGADAALLLPVPQEDHATPDGAVIADGDPVDLRALCEANHADGGPVTERSGIRYLPSGVDPVWSDMPDGPVDVSALAVAAPDGSLLLIGFRSPTLSTRATTVPLTALAELLSKAVADDRERAAAQRRHRELVARHRALELAHSVERTIVIASDGGLDAIIAASTELTGKQVAAFDARNRLIAHSPEHSEMAPLAALLGGHQENVTSAPDTAEGPGVRIVNGVVRAGVQRRHVLTPLLHGGTLHGWLVVVEFPTQLRPVDELIARRAAARIGHELTHLDRVATATWNARSALTRQLISGTSDPDDLQRSGRHLGVDTRAKRVLAYVRTRLDGAGHIDDGLLSREIERRLCVEVLTTRGSEGVVVLIPAPAGMSPVTTVRHTKAAIADICRRVFFDVPLVAGVSSVTDPAGLRRAYREARDVAGCIGRFAPPTGTRVLAVQDLGPTRLFLANSDVAAVRRYVDDVLGALLDGTPSSHGLLTTLETYFDCSRSVRTAATRLGLHQNTIRLRLARVHDLTGLDVGRDAADQLSVQTALLVLRLQGHPALAVVERMPSAVADAVDRPSNDRLP